MGIPSGLLKKINIQMTKLICFTVFFCTATFAHAQQTDSKQILRDVNLTFQKVKDYTADIKIKTDIPFINILPVNAKVFFKQPDKFHIQSKGIAILPKQGPENMMASLRDTAAFTAVFLMNDVLNGLPVAIINILPVSDTNDIVVGKFWIDVQRKIVMRSQITSKTNGTVNAEYVYGSNAAYALPDKVTFIIDTKKFKMPKAVSADLNNYAKENADKQKENKGKIMLSFSRYVINKGIDDAVFKKTKK